MTFELVLDVAIGLVLVFALFSLLTSTIVELISAMLRRRGRMLEYGIAQIFGEVIPARSIRSRLTGGKSIAALRSLTAVPGSENKTLTERFYDLAPIKALMDGDRLPSYVSTDAFVTSVMTLIHEDLDISNPDPDYGAAARLDEDASPLADIINELFPNQTVTRAKLEKRLRVYYDDATDRINGWYGRETQLWLLGVGALVAVIFNVNSIYIASELATNANLREQYVVMASDAEITALSASVRSDAADDASSVDKIISDKNEKINEITGHISKLTLPVGRCRGFLENDKNSSAAPATSGASKFVSSMRIDTNDLGTPCVSAGFDGAYRANLFVEIVGWALTAFAISLGAPFWFDLMSKLVAVRRAGKIKEAQEKKNDETEDGEATPPVIPGSGLSDGPTTGGAEGALAANKFEREFLSKDDIKAIQRLLGVDISGDLESAPMRQAIAAWKSARAYSSPNGFLSKDVVLQLFKEGGVTA